MRRPLLSILAAVVLALAVLAQPGAAAAASSTAPVTGVSTYTLLPDQGRIAVKKDIVVKNQIANRVSGSTVVKTYIKAVPIWVENEAANLTATASSGKVSPATAQQTTSGRWINLTISPVLFYGQSRTIHVGYDIPGGAPRSASNIRAGKAYASFCATGAGPDGGSLSVVFPSGYDVVDDVPMSESTSAGSHVMSSGSLANASTFSACFQATNDSAASHDAVSAAGQAFTVEAWPEDIKWATDVKSEIALDFPKLLSLTGLEVPGSGPINAIEVSDVTWGGGYVGRYLADKRSLYIVEHVDAPTVVHELSHVWFNADTLADPWMWEGLASYSEEAAGGRCTAPVYPGKGTPDLTNWKILGSSYTKDDAALVDFDYKAACWVFTDLAQQMGADRFKAVLAAAWNGEIPYAGAGQPEIVGNGGKLDAQRLLDLIDERGLRPQGIADPDVAQKLFAQYGILKDARILSARSGARAEYAALQKAAGSWKVPLAIRQAMTDWRFQIAQSAMETAQEILALRDQSAASVQGLSLDGTALQHDFESARDQNALDDVLEKAHGLSAASAKVAEAQVAYSADRGPIDTLGLVGTDVDAQMTQAKSSLQNGDTGQAVTAANSVLSTVEGARRAGLIRLAIVLVCMVLLVLTGLFVVAYARRRRKAALAAARATTTATMTVPGPAYGLWAYRPPTPYPQRGPYQPAPSQPASYPQQSPARAPGPPQPPVGQAPQQPPQPGQAPQPGQGPQPGQPPKFVPPGGAPGQG